MFAILNPKIVKTRTSHVCFGCGRLFDAGSQMERSCVIDGTAWTCYLCNTCVSVSENLESGSDFGFGDLREEALEIEAAGKENVAVLWEV